MMKRVFALFLCTLMFLSLLCGCSSIKNLPIIKDLPVVGTTTAVQTTTTISQTTSSASSAATSAMTTTASTTTTTTTTVQTTTTTAPVIPESAAYPHSWSLETAEDAADYLVGKWELYSADAHAEVMRLTLSENGSYMLELDTGAGLWYDEDNTAPTYHYSGAWELFPYEDCESGYAFSLKLNKTDDPVFDGWPTIGDFTFEEASFCDGKLMMELIQLNNGESVFTEHIGMDALWILMRDDDRELTEEPIKNDTFYALLWKTLYGSNEENDTGRYVLFADDIDMVNDFEYTNDIRESVPYFVSDNADESVSWLSGGPDGFFSHGDDVYLLTTDDKGEIISAEFVNTTPPPSEERAQYLLEDCPETRALIESGMDVHFDGISALWDESVLCVSIGTGSGDDYVSAGQYVITCDEYIYRFNELGATEFTPVYPLPDEDRAALLLEECDEVRQMLDSGMSMMYEGIDEFWDEYAAYVSLGTDHEDNFVREVQYAITADELIYRYDPIEDNWYWVDPAVMG